MRNRREHAELGSVYWMESSRRRQALAWLERADLDSAERSLLERFVERYRTGTGLAPGERRALLAAFDRLERRLGCLRPASPERRAP